MKFTVDQTHSLIDTYITSLRGNIKNSKESSFGGDIRVLADFIDNLHNIELTKHQINNILDSQKSEILSYLEQLANIRSIVFIERLANAALLLVNTLEKPWPEIYNILEKAKPKFIKDILLNISGQLNWPAKELLDILIKLNLQWPEFATIKKSLAHIMQIPNQSDNRELDEVDDGWTSSSEYRDHEKDIKDIITDIDYFTSANLRMAGLKQCIDNLLYYGVKPAKVRSIINRYKAKILEFLNKICDTPSLYYEMPQWLNLYNYMVTKLNINWPELPIIIENEKAAIIKLLLNEILKSNFETSKNVIRNLNKLGIDWPEFAVIIKSADAELAKSYRNIDDINESDESIAHEIQLVEQYLQDGMIYSALILIDRHDLTIDMPGLEEILNTYKHKIIVRLLQSIKDRKEFSADAWRIIWLHAAGIKWPELDIIKKSINADKELSESGRSLMYERYDFDYGTRAGTLDAIKYQLEHKFLVDALININDFELTVKDVGLEDLLNQHKHELITYLLNAIKKTIHYDMDLYNYAYMFMDDLIKTEIKWPELDIIKKSLDAEYNHRQASGTV